jgi:hypothetical protein
VAQTIQVHVLLEYTSFPDSVVPFAFGTVGEIPKGKYINYKYYMYDVLRLKFISCGVALQIKHCGLFILGLSLDTVIRGLEANEGPAA